MASISQAIEVSTAIYRQSASAAIMLRGKPGMGKSDACHSIARNLGIEADRTLVVHVNNHDVVDFTGVPSIVDGKTVFNPTDMFYQFREGTGSGVIVLEELAQASTHHQTWAAGFILERQTPTFKLDPQVRIIVTGNRAEDRAGAKPLLTHLANRLTMIDLDDSVDDWTDWAMRNGVDPMLVAFIRLRPELLNTFDPLQQTNATQRSWTQLSNDVPTDLPDDLYYIAAKGKVGEGAASEWAATRNIMHRMPNLDRLRANPTEAEVPSNQGDGLTIRYAITSALATTTSPDHFTNDMAYMTRLSREFQMMYLADTLRSHPELQETKVFTDWALANQDMFINVK
jgi:hypothetical protein